MEARVLSKVEAGFCHSCPVSALTPAQLRVVGTLVAKGLMWRLGATSRFPERFVLTPNAHHYRIGTFVMQDRGFRAQVAQASAEARKGRAA